MKFQFPWIRLPTASRRDSRQEFVAGLAIRTLGILEPAERREFMETSIREFFGFKRAEILLKPEGPERFSSESTRVRDMLSRILGILEGIQQPFLSKAVGREYRVAAVLSDMDASYLFPIRSGDARLGVLVIDTSPLAGLDPGTEDSLVDVCSQVALVLENSSLLQGKLELQHTVARQAQMVQLGEMTARIAHEIKNPLSAIKTIVQVMQEDPALHPHYTKDMQLISDEVSRLGQSVMQLLNFARPGPSSNERVSIRAAAESAVQFLERDVSRESMAIENEIPQNLPELPGSISAFREIFLNLILNAIQAGAHRLRFDAWEGILEDGSEKFVLVVVEDDGPGIAPEVGDRVFEPFYTTRQRGTGLGLAIVRRDIEHLGGRITLESPARDGRGARFLIHLPIL